MVARAEEFKLPAETEAAPAEGEPGTPEGNPAGLDPATAIEQFNQAFEGLRLPIGWMAADLAALDRPSAPGCGWHPWYDKKYYVWGIPLGNQCIVPVGAPEGIPREWGYLLLKIGGYAISGVAASFGAPFWFDVLKKLTNVRTAGKNPAEASK